MTVYFEVRSSSRPDGEGEQLEPSRYSNCEDAEAAARRELRKGSNKRQQADGFVFFIRKPDYFHGAVKFDVLALKVGDVGYWQGYEHQVELMDLPDDVADSAISGSMFGWDCPAAQKAIEYAAAKGGVA